MKKKFIRTGFIGIVIAISLFVCFQVFGQQTSRGAVKIVSAVTYSAQYPRVFVISESGEYWLLSCTNILKTSQGPKLQDKVDVIDHGFLKSEPVLEESPY